LSHAQATVRPGTAARAIERGEWNMATSSSRLPRWYLTIYGGDEDAWEPAKAQCRSVLRAWAVKRRYGYYADLVPKVTAIDWPEGPHTHEGSQMGYLLGQVSLAELDRDVDRPLISALVVEKDGGRPSTGFWNLCRELGMADAVSSPGRRDAFWQEEIKRCWEEYGRRPGDVEDD
jgi:hypothetical protein